MKQYKNIYVIHNPISGKQDAEAVTQEIKDYLGRVKIKYKYRQTQVEGDATSWACEAVTSNDYDLVIVAGGDGKIMEVLRGILKCDKSIPLLIIPLGTANMLSRALDLPLNTDRVLDLCIENSGSKEQLFDIGYIINKDLYFCLAVGAGINAEVVRDANRELKNQWGIFAYIITLFKHLFTRRLHNIELNYDGKVQSLRAHSVMILNASRFSVSGLHFGPASNPHDGMLDTVIMKRISVFGTLQKMGRMLTGGVFQPLMLKSAKQITITATPPLPIQADGEIIGETPLKVTVLPEAVTFLVPATYPSSRLLS